MVVSNYNGPKYVVESFLELGLDRNLKILDFLAGTGLVAELVRLKKQTKSMSKC